MIPKSVVFPAIRPNLATFSPMMRATGHSTDSVNLEDLTMFGRTVLTSSSRLRIKGCWSCWKEDSKFYTQGMKTHKQGYGLIFCPKKSHRHRYLNVIFYDHLNENSQLLAQKILQDPDIIKKRRILRVPCYKKKLSKIKGTLLGNILTNDGCNRAQLCLDLVNLENLTMFCRTVLTSSSGLKIKGYRSCLKEDSKSYTPRMKAHKQGHGLSFYPKKSHRHRYLNAIFYNRP